MSNAQVLPDLEIGVETPWPLKREGKQVYAKLIDFGGFPAPYGLKTKTHDVPDIEWSQISWDYSYVAGSADDSRRSLALVSTPAASGGSMPWRFLVDSNSVQVNMLTNTDYREWDTIVLCLLYTKESEGAESGSLIAPGEEETVLITRDGQLVWEETSALSSEPANPSIPGLAPEGGRPGQFYRVADDGESYEWSNPEVEKTVITESGEWTPPAPGLYRVRGVAGGGGGGGVSATGYCAVGAGGGASGQEADMLIRLTDTEPLQVVIGEGGAGGNASSGLKGGDAGPTSFGTYFRLAGGLGAHGATGADKHNYFMPGGHGCGFGSNAGGAATLRGSVNGGQATGVTSGFGGSSSFGCGGISLEQQGQNSRDGRDAQGYGSGGSGAMAMLYSGNQASRRGGNGTPGCIVIERIR